MDLLATLRTDAGMHVLWDRYHFPGVVDYPTWESELVEDENIERRHIAMGHIVPIKHPVGRHLRDQRACR